VRWHVNLGRQSERQIGDYGWQDEFSAGGGPGGSLWITAQTFFTGPAHNVCSTADQRTDPLWKTGAAGAGGG